MAVLRILTWGDPLLRKVSRPVEPSEIDDAFRSWCDDLVETMYAEEGVGLAAIQVGRPVRVLCVDVQYSDSGIKSPVVYVNPVVTAAAPPCLMDEGCLSVPGVRGKVNRPERVDVEWTDLDGVRHHREGLEGMEARCLQHEMDPLEGVVFVDKLSAAARSLVSGKLRRLAQSSSK